MTLGKSLPIAATVLFAIEMAVLFLAQPYFVVTLIAGFTIYGVLFAVYCYRRGR